MSHKLPHLVNIKICTIIEVREAKENERQRRKINCAIGMKI